MTKDIVLADFYFFLIGNYQKCLGYVDKGKEFGGNEMCYLYAAVNRLNIKDYKNSKGSNTGLGPRH
jgi:hypothetical protein